MRQLRRQVGFLIDVILEVDDLIATPFPGVIAEVDEGTEQELVSLAANPQPFPPPVLVEAPDQVQEFQASIAQVTTLFTTYNKVLHCANFCLTSHFVHSASA